MSKKLKGKKLDAVVNAAFYSVGRNRQFGIFDLSKIAKRGRDAYEAAATHEDGLVAAQAAVSAACDEFEYRPAAQS